MHGCVWPINYKYDRGEENVDDLSAKKSLVIFLTGSKGEKTCSTEN